MLLRHIITALSSACLSVNAAAPQDSRLSEGSITESDSPPDSEFLEGFPICGAKGFTQVPGNFTQLQHQLPGATLKSCLDDCRKDAACLSVGYADVYTGCWFYTQFTQSVQLIVDNSAYFDHYDEVCFPFDYCPTKK